MSDAKNGGPAFPTGLTPGHYSQEGMSMRDWLAGQAINAAFSAAWDADMTVEQNASVAASWSYAIADAMLEARK